MNNRLLRFLLVGGICFGINLAILYTGTELFGFHYLVSTIISILVTNILGWLLNRNWTFDAKHREPIRQLLKYLAANSMSYLVSLALMALLVSVLNTNYLLASAIVAVAMALINYALHKNWSFS